MQPDWKRREAASGTQNTANSVSQSHSDIILRAVVLPAQGPPVKQIL